MNQFEQIPDSKLQESLKIRGVCAAIQEMAYPTMQNVIDLLKEVGINIKRIR